MTTVADVCRYLESFAPTALAEDWDNVGLLLGDRKDSVASIMTCLTVTADVVEEAIFQEVDLLVAHHPIPFKGIKRISTDSPTGKLLWKLASNGICLLYTSPSPRDAHESRMPSSA